MKKRTIALILLPIIAVSVIAYFMLQPKEDVRVAWILEEYVGYNAVRINVYNYGDTDINISRVQLIYLPDETLGLIWIEQRIIRSPKGTDREYWCGVNGSFRTSPLSEENPFFNLLWERRYEPIVRIEVETQKAIYTFYPERHDQLGNPTKPTTIEEK